MSRADDVTDLAAAIRRDLADGAWHRAAGLGGWGHTLGTKSAALDQLLQAEAVEYDARTDEYRLVPHHSIQTTIYDQEATR